MSGVRCAACLQPIVGKGFVIADTEVLHSACAPRAGSTERWRAKKEILRLEGELAHATASDSEKTATIQRQASEIERLRREISQAQVDARNQMVRAEDAATKTTQALAREGVVRAQLQTAEIDRDSARRELTNAMNELRVLRLVGPPKEQEAKGPDDRDPTSVRFSLLETD